MLQCCRRNCAERGLENSRLYNADLRSLDLPRRYDAIILSYGSFGLIEDRTEAAVTLHNLARHLNPGGRLFIDLDAPPTGAGEWSSPRTVSCEDGSVITLKSAASYAAAEQVEDTLLRYERLRSGRMVQAELQRLTVRHYGSREFADLLRAASFTGVELRRDYREEREDYRHAAASAWRCYSARLDRPI